jgi:hypothetical protein
MRKINIAFEQKSGRCGSRFMQRTSKSFTIPSANFFHASISDDLSTIVIVEIGTNFVATSRRVSQDRGENSDPQLPLI